MGVLGPVTVLGCYPEQQIDSQGKSRSVWVFELRVHSDPMEVRVAKARSIMSNLYSSYAGEIITDAEVVRSTVPESGGNELDLAILEPIRRRLLGYEPRQFEHIIHDLLRQSGFEQVEVTKYSQDGGICKLPQNQVRG